MSETIGLDEALENMKDNPPDGFMINLIYYDTSVTNNSHPLHGTMELIKADFGLEMRKNAVQVKELQFFQVDLIWFGKFKNLGSELKRLDNILSDTNNMWQSQGIVNGQIGSNLSFVMKAENTPDEAPNPDDELF
jgi:hypothetical protein